ncbi:DUF397 domain-containing protein [Actinophytocola glycyrrhizae]|uniref:DUF397 domain-containing protein n=1 Tax=Actinophytocola glycyrrhizae TaxID=2044873 RepID=A0ABV9S6F4_9PSEU
MPLTTWRKSGFSSEPAGNCVEVAWRKSSFSEEPQGNCVEVAFVPAAVAVRDSKNIAGPTLAFDPRAWRTFVTRR